MRRVLLLLFVLTPVFASGPAAAWSWAHKEQPNDGLRRIYEAYRADEIEFYVAKGAPNACGQGCDTWIAAEGSFDRGAARRLRKFLKRDDRDTLPIFFYSNGGSAVDAMEVGRLLRKRKMIAGVARTTPKECGGASAEEACERLKHAGTPLPSALVTEEGVCNSACAFALIGAVRRELAQDVTIGVHAAVVFRVRRSGMVVAGAKKQLNTLNARLKKYITDMGVDPELFDLMQATPHKEMRYLTRDEIARFNIDPRQVIETRWSVEQPGLHPIVVKSISAQREQPAREYRSSFLLLSCDQPSEIKVQYARSLAPSEADARSGIRLASRDGAVEFPERGQSNEPARVRTARVPAKFFESAASGNALEITETFLPSAAPGWSTVTKISTIGLSEALPKLLKNCH
jgi:hypothetical protein